MRRRHGLPCRIISAFVSFAFLTTTFFYATPGFAQGMEMLNLPVPGTMVQPSAAFVPVLLKGMTVHPDDPLKFDFIVDSGNTDLTQNEIKTESERLVKYFLASMTVPTGDFWVNLSPKEQDRIIPEELSRTELGRDLLAQDYLLKQITASLMYPEKEMGKKFWAAVRAKAQEKFGTAEIPMNSFNKVWILPESATVYEHENTVYVVGSRLKVLTDQEYMSQGHKVTGSEGDGDGIEAAVIREIIVPEIEREVNEGRHFALLRQIYHSLILAKWYKETVKNSLLSEVYIDQNKVVGVDDVDAQMKNEIYKRYMKAYKKGVYNYIKRDYDELTKKPIPRKYFSGGIKDRAILVKRTHQASLVQNAAVGKNYNVALALKVKGAGADEAMVVGELPSRISDLKNGSIYSLPQVRFGQPNLFTLVAMRNNLVVKISSQIGREDFEMFVKQETRDAEAIRQNELLERFNNLEKAVRIFPEFQEVYDFLNKDIAHYLVVHRLQYERLKSSGLVGVPDTRFVVLDLNDPNKEYSPAIIQENVPGVPLKGMIVRKRKFFWGTKRDFSPQYLPIKQALSEQVGRLLNSGMEKHIDWSIDNFVWNEKEGRLYYIDSKVTTMASRSSVEHNKALIRHDFVGGDMAMLVKKTGQASLVQDAVVGRDFKVAMEVIPQGEKIDKAILTKLKKILGLALILLPWESLFAMDYFFPLRAQLQGFKEMLWGGALINMIFPPFWFSTYHGFELLFSKDEFTERLDMLNSSDYNDRKYASDDRYYQKGNWGTNGPDYSAFEDEDKAMVAKGLGTQQEWMKLRKEKYSKILKMTISFSLFSAFGVGALILANFDNPIGFVMFFLSIAQAVKGWEIWETIPTLKKARRQLGVGHTPSWWQMDTVKAITIVANSKKKTSGDIERLLKYLQNGNREVRDLAKKALEELGATKDQFIQGYINALYSYPEYGDSGEVRQEAAEALGMLGDIRAVTHLISKIGDGRRKVRDSAKQALEKLGATKEQLVLGYYDVLANSLESNSRLRAAMALVELDAPADIQNKAKEFIIEEKTRRQEAKRTLAEIRRRVKDLSGSEGGLSEEDLERIDQEHRWSLHKMGRWQDEGVEIDLQTRTLTIKNAKRLPNRGKSDIEKEFRGKGRADIPLTFRPFGVEDKKELEQMVSELNADYSASVEYGTIDPDIQYWIMERDEMAREHRITGLGFGDQETGKLNVFLRADIIHPQEYLEGDDLEWWSNLTLPERHNMKKEALHHEILHAMNSDWSHDDIRYNLQFEGRFTELSKHLIQNDKKNVGGIDLNEINVERQGSGTAIQFDPAQLEGIEDLQIDGFAPVIISITPLTSILPLLGLAPVSREEELALSMK